MRDAACPEGCSPAEGRYGGSLRWEEDGGNRRGQFPGEHLEGRMSPSCYGPKDKMGMAEVLPALT